MAFAVLSCAVFIIYSTKSKLSQWSYEITLNKLTNIFPFQNSSQRNHFVKPADTKPLYNGRGGYPGQPVRHDVSFNVHVLFDAVF